MSEMEKLELANRIKALDPEEVGIVIRLLPTNILFDELERRNKIQEQMIFNVRNALMNE